MPLIEEFDVFTTGDGRARVPRTPLLSRSAAVQIAVSAVVAVLCTVIWALTDRNPYFWPRWIWMPLAVGALLQISLRWAARRTRGPAARGLALHATVAAVAMLFLCLVWAFTTAPGYFWPVWPLLAWSTSLAIHAAAATTRRRSPGARERELVSRVDELTRTRRGALDVQTVELRRIERDLHDGAQARLVSLSLQLGRAEERLHDHPEAAGLVRAAHRDADLAIAELRELARGIAPPILTDRGLVEAVRALGRRSGIRVAVRADVPRRLPPSVELAAYFIVAEALTNAVKHAGTPEHPATATITLDLVAATAAGATLVVQVADDGPGGADGLGSGLRGLAQRAAALDGAFSVGDLGTPSIAGGSVGGTVVRAELPCAP